MIASRTPHVPAHRSALALALILLALIALGACSTPAPSMIERLPPVQRGPGEELLEPDPERPRRSDASADAAKDSVDASEESEPVPAVGPAGNIVLRAEIVAMERFGGGVRVDALVPHDAFHWVVTFRVDEVLEGRWPDDTLRVVLRSPAERFAYPMSSQRKFRIVLEPGRGSEYQLVDNEPKGHELLRALEDEENRTSLDEES
jgi:hypothetical protein